MEETLATAATEIAETIPEILETVGETGATIYETVVETVAETTISLAEELSPIYDVLTAQNNLLVVGICALGLCAGILLGMALWRWLR